MAGEAIGAFISCAARFKNCVAKFGVNRSAISCTDTYVLTYSQTDAKKIPDLSQLGTSHADHVAGIPLYGTPHWQFPHIYAQVFDAVQVNDDPGCFTWHITVEYSKIEVQSGGGGSPSDPILIILARSWGYETLELPLNYDAITSEPVINSAGDPFLSTTTVSIPVTKIIFSRRENIPPASRTIYNMTLNSAAITLMGIAIPPRCGLLKVTMQDNLDQSARRYTYNYEILVRNQLVYLSPGASATQIGWDEGIIQRGLYHLVPDTSKPGGKRRVRFMEESVTIDSSGDTIVQKDEDDNPIMEPSANVCLLTDTGADNRGNAPYLKRTSLHGEMNWSVLGLPST